MSYCKEDGKDKIIFVTHEDHKKPSTIILANDAASEPGLILPNGEINWNCPCLGGMASGPCGYQFQSAFSCFHHSEAEPKGSDCYEEFTKMQECMTKYPTLYGSDKDDEKEDEFAQLQEVDDKSVKEAKDSKISSSTKSSS